MAESSANPMTFRGAFTIKLPGWNSFKKCICQFGNSQIGVFDKDGDLFPSYSHFLGLDTKCLLADTELLSITDGDFNLEVLISDLSEVAQLELAIKTVARCREALSMDDFSIISVIGRGFFGKVMLVEKKKTGELFAIKSIRKSKLQEESNSDTVRMERNIMLMVKHPFIVELKFAFQTSTKLYMGLEYAPGGDLFFHLSHRGTFTIESARLYCAEIALALDHLHSCGIVYRDIKPENILLDQDGHVLLTDFGLAKQLKFGSKTSTLCGTEHYLAPEIIAGLPYDYAIDWWALGVLLSEMLTGSCPFVAENTKKLFDSIINNKPMLPSFMDEDAADLICYLLIKDPSLRPSFKDIKNHPFFQSLDWEIVKNRQYQPLFVPTPRHSSSLEYFDQDFVQEMPVDSTGSFIDCECARVEGFSFDASPLLEDQEITWNSHLGT